MKKQSETTKIDLTKHESGFKNEKKFETHLISSYDHAKQLDPRFVAEQKMKKEIDNAAEKEWERLKSRFVNSDYGFIIYSILNIIEANMNWPTQNHKIFQKFSENFNMHSYSDIKSIVNNTLKNVNDKINNARNDIMENKIKALDHILNHKNFNEAFEYKYRSDEGDQEKWGEIMKEIIAQSPSKELCEDIVKNIETFINLFIKNDLEKAFKDKTFRNKEFGEDELDNMKLGDIKRTSMNLNEIKAQFKNNLKLATLRDINKELTKEVSYEQSKRYNIAANTGAYYSVLNIIMNNVVLSPKHFNYITQEGGLTYFTPEQLKEEPRKMLSKFFDKKLSDEICKTLALEVGILQETMLSMKDYVDKTPDLSKHHTNDFVVNIFIKKTLKSLEEETVNIKLGEQVHKIDIKDLPLDPKLIKRRLKNQISDFCDNYLAVAKSNPEIIKKLHMKIDAKSSNSEIKSEQNTIENLPSRPSSMLSSVKPEFTQNTSVSGTLIDEVGPVQQNASKPAGLKNFLNTNSKANASSFLTDEAVMQSRNKSAQNKSPKDKSKSPER